MSCLKYHVLSRNAIHDVWINGYLGEAEMPIFRIYIFGHKEKKIWISLKKKILIFCFFLDNICRKLYKMAKKWKLGWGDPVNCAYRMRFFASKMSKNFLKGGFAPSAHNLYAIEINFLFLIFCHTLLASLVQGISCRLHTSEWTTD